jgi:hypothetical protein
MPGQQVYKYISPFLHPPFPSLSLGTKLTLRVVKKFDEVIGVKYLVGLYLTESLNDSVEVGVLETRTPSLLRVKTLAIGCVLPWGVLGSMEVPLWRGWETRRKQWKCRGMRSMEEMVDEIRKAVGNSRGIRVRMRG